MNLCKIKIPSSCKRIIMFEKIYITQVPRGNEIKNASKTRIVIGNTLSPFEVADMAIRTDFVLPTGVFPKLLKKIEEEGYPKDSKKLSHIVFKFYEASKLIVPNPDEKEYKDRTKHFAILFRDSCAKMMELGKKSQEVTDKVVGSRQVCEGLVVYKMNVVSMEERDLVSIQRLKAITSDKSFMIINGTDRSVKEPVVFYADKNKLPKKLGNIAIINNGDHIVIYVRNHNEIFKAQQLLIDSMKNQN